MSKKALIIILLLLIKLPASSGQDSMVDAEQQHLALCYNYSKILGCVIDTISETDLFQTVYDWLGVPYRYSGNTKDGIDCSGFVDVIFRNVYKMELPGSSTDIYKEAEAIKKNKLIVGDLVFFKIRKKRVSHVGVYIGNNKFAHASVQQGVVISDLDEPYYRKYFYKAGRVKMPEIPLSLQSQ